MTTVKGTLNVDEAVTLDETLDVTGDITGNLTGNADTATKIASITNSDIVQLDETQTLTNKTLTSPTLTGVTTASTISATSITDGTATLSSGALSGVTTISTSGNVTSSGGSISGFDAALNDQTGISYSLTSSDNGKVITLDNANAITLTIPSGLGDGFNCLIVQKGAGQVTLSASGTVLINRQSHIKTAGQYAVVSIVNIGNDNIIVGGDTGS
jgi:hypothetical protein